MKQSVWAGGSPEIAVADRDYVEPLNNVAPHYYCGPIQKHDYQKIILPDELTAILRPFNFQYYAQYMMRMSKR